MEERFKYRNKGLVRLNMLVSPELREALLKYCEERRRGITTVVTMAIEEKIGYPGKPAKKQSNDAVGRTRRDFGGQQPVRLDIRIDADLKKALKDYSGERGITPVVIEAIEERIGFGTK